MNKGILMAATIAAAALGASAQGIAPTEEKGPVIEVKTTEGDFQLVLYNDTPLHEANFLKLVKEGVYDGLLFHRVINEFMVQAGDPSSKNAEAGVLLGDNDGNYTVPAEFRYPARFHKRGALAAARIGDAENPERASSAYQFYVVEGRKYTAGQLAAMEAKQTDKAREAYFKKVTLENRGEIEPLLKEAREAADSTARTAAVQKLDAIRDRLVDETVKAVPEVRIPDNIKQVYMTEGGTPHLDGAYTVFGEVIQGMDTIDRIQKVETDKNDRPLKDVRILSMKVLRE